MTMNSDLIKEARKLDAVPGMERWHLSNRARYHALLPQLADALEAAEQNVNDLNGILAKTLAAGDYRAGLLEARLAKVRERAIHHTVAWCRRGECRSCRLCVTTWRHDGTERHTTPDCPASEVP